MTTPDLNAIAEKWARSDYMPSEKDRMIRALTEATEPLLKEIEKLSAYRFQMSTRCRVGTATELQLLTDARIKAEELSRELQQRLEESEKVRAKIDTDRRAFIAELESVIQEQKNKLEELQKDKERWDALTRNEDVCLSFHRNLGGWVVHRGEPNLTYISSGDTPRLAIDSAMQSNEKK